MAFVGRCAGRHENWSAGLLSAGPGGSRTPQPLGSKSKQDYAAMQSFF